MPASTDIDHTDTLIGYTASIVTAHVSRHQISHLDVPYLIQTVYSTLLEVARANPGSAPSERATRRDGKPGTTPDILTCLECGMRMKMLKRHLLTVHGLTPEDYRRKHGLSADAPMVTSNYAALRSQLAKASGLGKRPNRRGGRS